MFVGFTLMLVLICCLRSGDRYIDCVFLFLDVRDNDRNGYERLAAKFEWIACQAAQKSLFDLFQCGAVLLAEGLRPSVGIYDEFLVLV